MASTQSDPTSDSRIGRGAFAAVAIALASVLLMTRPSGVEGSDSPPLRIDPNRAPRQVLMALPGLGPARVSAIESARSGSPFRSLDDFDRRVKGIGPVISSSLRPYLRFQTP